MAEILLQSREQRLGSLVRWILNNTDITAIERGSDTAILLEAIAEQLSRVEMSALKILETTDIESLVGSALDKKAQSMRIPNFAGGYGRKAATQTSGPVQISSNFEKILSSLYAGKPSPYSGSTVLYLRDGSSFPATGSVYIGRNSIDRFEGPIPYTSLVNSGSFWTMTLSNALTKSHLHSDSVVLSQGGIRSVPVGTKVLVPASQDTPVITFSTTKELIIPDGEKSGTINVVCDQFGTVGNVLSGAITTFQSSPFSGALVTNPTTYRNGKSIENDEDLRQRIRDYPATLSRGTRGAILSAILGAVDEDSGRSIQSAIVLDPAESGDYARIFIDDGTGLEPSFQGQASDIFIQNASGQETRFRTAQFPVSSVLVAGSEQSPFVLQDGQNITFEVDGEVETYYIRAENYVNINSATSYEIIKDLNSQANLIGFRTLDDGKRIVATDLTNEAETLQVYPSDLQEIIGFPISSIRTIFVYKDNELLSYKGKTANLETRPYNDWSLNASHLENVRVKVDGVIQTFSITDDDFDEFQTSIATATISQWATVFSRKIAGIKFTVFGNILRWTTWQENSPNGSIEILEEKADGSQAGWIGSNRVWLPENAGGKLSDVGDDKDYKFNRFTGEVVLLNKPEEGSTVEAGIKASEASIISKNTSAGLFNLSPFSATLGSSKLIVGFDGVFSVKEVIHTSTSVIGITQPDAVNKYNVFRITSSDQNIFSESSLFDYIYLNQDVGADEVLPSNLQGLYQIIDKGNQLIDSQQTQSGLSASTEVYNSVQVSVVENSSTVSVFKTNHGLRTGDLVSINTSTAIGGIAALDLSVNDTPVIVLSDNYYTFEASSDATTSTSGFLDTIGTNRLIVSHVSHGLSEGSVVQVDTLNDFSEILIADINGNRSIEFINNDSYYIRADAAAITDESDTLSTVYYLVDTYVDIEVSEYKHSDFVTAIGTSYNVTEGMISLFTSSVIPQVIDFTASVGSLTVDQVVSIINANISSGKAEKINPRSLRLKSNKLEQDFDSGSCAVLATIANASNLFSTQSSESIQSHTASVYSKKVFTGSPVFNGVEFETSNYPTRQYLKMDYNIVNVLDDNDTPSIENDINYHSSYPEGFIQYWITGRGYNFSARVYNNQTTQPYTGVMIKEHGLQPIGTWDVKQDASDTLNRYSGLGFRFRDVSFNNHDKLVIEMDLDDSDKTVSVPMYKKAKIQNIDSISGSGKGQVISFRLKDSEDSNKPFFDSDSIYKTFSLVDFKILTKSVGLYKIDGSDKALIIRSEEYGDNSKIRFSIRYPTEADLATPVITHTNDYYNDQPRTNVIVTLPSDSEITGAAMLAASYKVSYTVLGSIYKLKFYSGYLNNNSGYTVGNILSVGGTGALSNSYKIVESVSINEQNVNASTAAGSNVINITLASHGLETGDMINVSSTTNIGRIPASDLTRNNAIITKISDNTFSYEALSSALQINASNVPASVITGSATVTVNISGHGLQTNDLITVTTTSDIGGIPAADLEVTDAQVTVLTVNTFTYQAASNATSSETSTLDTLTSNAGNDTGLLNTLKAGSVTVLAPSDGGISSPSTYDAAKNPIRTWPLLDITIEDFSDFINNYLIDSPVVSSEAIGTDIDITNITEATYVTHPSTLTTGDMSAAFVHHSFDCYYAGSAGIWQYDSSDENINGIKATVQHEDPIFPTITDSSGTSYSPIDEEVMIVPTSTNTLREWINFKGVTTLNLLATIEKIESDSELQIASKTFGSSGAVQITGVNANSVASSLSGNASLINNSVKLRLLTSEAQSLMKEELVSLRNSITSDITREYKLVPVGSEITNTNSTDITSYFRETHSIRYIRLDNNRARLMFIRDGSGFGQTEPLSAGNQITFTDLGNGLVRVTSAKNTGATDGLLLARTGDMMYISPTAVNFPLDSLCKAISSSTGITDSLNPEYLGYPVIKVEDTNNILILAPNIISFGTYDIDQPEDLVFIPAIWNEKNIQTNHKAGAHFDYVYNNNACKYIIKPFGNGLVSVIIQNSDNESTDDMLLDDLMVNTDDFAYFGEEFDLANQGTFRIIAHNGRNMMIIYNQNGGEEELTIEDAKWTGGLLNDGYDRSLRIISANSVQIGDYLRISTPSDLGQWFNNTLIGSWKIEGIGFIGQSFNSGDLPYVATDGSVDLTQICPYVDVIIPNAPAGIKNSSGDYIDSFYIGNNTSSIGFSEATPFECFRIVKGRAINPQNTELTDVFITPTISYNRFAEIFGTIVTSMSKLGYESNTRQGIDGYNYYTGLIRTTHRIIDGLPDDPVLYPGVRAAGSLVQVDTPLIRPISLSLQVKPKDGVTLNSISELVQSTTAEYVNSLGVGKPVILSEIIRAVQGIPGVYSVEIVDSETTDDRIVVSDIEKAYILNSSTDVSVG